MSFEVFKTFDINVCKKAITSKGLYLEDPSVYDKLTLLNASSNSFQRFFKYSYIYNKKDFVTAGNLIIDKYINNTTPVACYYTETKYTATNLLLYNVFSKHGCFSKYMQEQAKIHTPEFLI